MEPNNSEFIDTTIILNGTTYSFSPSLEINGSGKPIEVQQLKFDRLSNSDLISETGILLEANNRGYFYVPMKDNTQLVSNDILTTNDITTNHSEDSSTFNLNLDVSQEQPTSTTKRKGGWPKGKKRKKQVETSKAPKAPITGYVRFLNERRQIYKELHPELVFAEVTRILGSEWSNLGSEEKKKYLNEADEDKKRYREELKAYLQSDEYQMQLKRKKLNICKSNSEHLGDVIAFNSVDEIDDEDSDELYCKVCDQFFNSLHNKREHLYGKHHLQMVTGDCKKIITDKGLEDKLTNETSTENSRSPRTSLSQFNPLMQKSNDTEILRDPVNVQLVIDNLLTATIERETEISSLKEHLEQHSQTNEYLSKQLATMREVKRRLENELMQLKNSYTKFNEQIESLKMIPTLFHVINF